jgi:CBS domain containing-hemolysin-like protein
MTILFVTIAVILTIIGGVLTAIDGAMQVSSRHDLLDEAEQVKNPKPLRAIAQDVAPHHTALTFMRVIVETFAGVLITLAFVQVFDHWWMALLMSAVVIIGVAFVVVGSSPRSVGMTYPRQTMRLGARLVRLIRIVLGPLAELLIVIGRFVTPGRPSGGALASEEQLRSLVDEAAEHDVLEAEDRELLHSVFDFGDTIVREVMVPRTDMITIHESASVGDAMTVFMESGASRLPVTAKDIDDVVGLLYVKDIAREVTMSKRSVKSASIKPLVKKAVFLPESKKADDALRFLQQEKTHLSLVVDEYGGISGLVTMEDLIEELVGEITDEYDEAEGGVEDLGNDHYRVWAKYSVDDFFDQLDIDLDEEDDDVDTVGGLMSKYLGRLLEAGSVQEAYGLVFEAEAPSSQKARVQWIRVRPTPEFAEVLASRREIDRALTGELPQV